MTNALSKTSSDLFIVSSPSGGGKTTLIRRLLENPPGEPLHFSVSHTTRPPRPGEQDGCEYHFVKPAQFREMVAQGEFLEHNDVHGHLYGTSRKEVVPRLAAGVDVILDVDVKGARDIRKAYPSAVTIFVVPPSRDILEKRLRERGLNDSLDIEVRLVNAAKEIQEALEGADGNSFSFQYLILNDELDIAVSELKSIVWARRLTTARQAERLSRLAKQFR